MATIVQMWEADGPNGEALIREYRRKVMDALADAANARPARCVLVTYYDTREPEKYVELWRKPGYRSGTGEGPGLLQQWAKSL